MPNVAKSILLRRTFAVLAAAVALACPSLAVAAGCAQQWSKFGDFLVELGNADTPPPAIARSMADGGCRVSGIELPFDRRTYLVIQSITWNGEGMERILSEGLPPRRLNIAINGVRRKSAFGIPDVDKEIDKHLATLTADITFAAHWDEETRTASLDMLSVQLLQGDSLTVEASADNVDFSSKSRMQMSATAFSIPNARIIFETVGTFERFLEDPLGVNLWGRSDNRAERVATMEGNVDLLPDALVPRASKEAIKALLKDAPAPTGPVQIDVSASPGLGPVRFLPYVTGLATKGDRADFWTMLEGVRVDVNYPAD